MSLRTVAFSSATMKMDTFFLSHGGPNILFEAGFPITDFLRSWRSAVLPERPKAILVVSAHWDTSAPAVNLISGANDTIYDFYGFPRRYYETGYPAPGAPDLAKRVKELLERNAGIKQVKEDRRRGLDHGTWIPLKLMYPDADIPVCQLSIQSSRSALYHYNLGKAVAPLAEEGVLVIGSGNATHNLRAIDWDGGAPKAQWAIQFDDWLKDSLLAGRFDEVNNVMEKAPHARMAHPTPDHLYPLHFALGAAAGAAATAKAHLAHHSFTNGSVSFASYRFTPSADA